MSAVPADAPRFGLQLTIPVGKEFLRAFQSVAVNNREALPLWAEGFLRREEEEAVYFTEREWRGLSPQPVPHRVDLYTIQRGLAKVFDPKYDLSIALRQLITQALFEQHIKGSPVLQLNPRAVSRVVQLALFDQVVYG